MLQTGQAGSTQAAAAKRRPFGLIAIIVTQLITVAFCALALGVLALVRLGHIAAAEIDFPPQEQITAAAALVVNALCAFGLWRRKRWAWYLTMLQLGFFMLSDLYSYFNDQPIATYVWSMVLNVCMVFYLNQREVQNVFRTRPANDTSQAGGDLEGALASALDRGLNGEP